MYTDVIHQVRFRMIFRNKFSLKVPLRTFLVAELRKLHYYFPLLIQDFYKHNICTYTFVDIYTYIYLYTTLRFHIFTKPPLVSSSVHQHLIVIPALNVLIVIIAVHLTSIWHPQYPSRNNGALFLGAEKRKKNWKTR